MQLIFFAVASLITVLAFFSLLANRNSSSIDVLSNSVTASLGLPAISQGSSPDTPIIVVNELNRRAFSMGGAGYGSCFANNFREQAEQLFRQRRFHEAIENFKKSLQDNPGDIRSLLGLGKSYVEVHNYEDAIRQLSLVRNECHRHRCEAEADPEPIESVGFYKDIGYSDLDTLPDQAREAIDYEARMALEKAVIALPINSNLKDSATREYKNEHHYLVLKSCLALARYYHFRSRREEMSALFRLANENTRNLPVDLINELTVNGTTDEQWSQLARLTLNALIPEERDWYETLLAGISNTLPKTDIRRAASDHFRGVHSLEDDTIGSYEAEEACDILKSLNIPRDVFMANCAYDRGRIAYASDNNSDALARFQQALSAYSRLNSRVDMADTEFNIGCTYQKSGDQESAKRAFMRAARYYRELPSNKENERLASYNAAALAVDGKTKSQDEDFLREYHSRFNSTESATMLALYLFKSNKFEASLEPFRVAVKNDFAEVDRYSWPHQISIANDDTTTFFDRTLSDEEVLQELFARTDRVDEYVNTRWSPTEPVLPKSYSFCHFELTKERSRDYANLAASLYPRALERTGKHEELLEFKEQLQKSRSKWRVRSSPPCSANVKYLNLIENTLQGYWYCPNHECVDQTVVRVKIDKEGNLKLVSVARVGPFTTSSISLRALEDRITASIVDETLTWASPMPPPPPGLVDKELIVLFDAQSQPAIPPIPGALPMPGRCNSDGGW